MPRKKKTSSFIAYILSVLLIIIIFLGFFTGLIKIDLTSPTSKINADNIGTNFEVIKNKENSKKDTYYANEKLSIKGIIYKIPYNLKIGVNFKLKQGDKEFFIKSDKYVLDNYENQFISGTGEIVGFYADNTPVINIISINNITELNDKEEKKVSNQYISYSGLKIDLENTNYSILLTGSNIFITDFFTGTIYSGENLTGNKYLKVSVFKCTEGDYTRDCKALLRQAKNLKFRNIVSDNGVVFYLLPETNTYFAINTEYGYYFTPLSGNLLNFMNFILLEDTKNKKIQIIKNTCKNDKIKLKDILKLSYSGDNYEVIGFDENSNKIICRLSLSNNNGIYVGNLKYLKYFNQDIKIKSEQIDETKYLKYRSRAYGYMLYMPKSVKYYSKNIKQDFGISGLKCLQQVDIADWKTGTLDSPDVEVYYCKTNLDKESLDKLLSVKNFNYTIYKLGDKTFIIKYRLGKGQDIVSEIRIF